MASGLPNKEKVRIRQLYAEGKADRVAPLESEAASLSRAGDLYFLRNGEHQPDGGRIYGACSCRARPLSIRMLRCGKR